MFDENILRSSGDLHHNSLIPIINVNNDTNVDQEINRVHPIIMIN